MPQLIPNGRADEPLTSRLESLSAAAESLSRGDSAAAESAARVALTVTAPAADSARARLSLGAALAGGGRFAEAAPVLLAAEPGLPPDLRQGGRLRLGEALFYAGRPGAAGQVFAAAAAGEGPLADRARWREADALLEAGLFRQAVRAYQALLLRAPRHPAAPGARLSLAAALRALGQDDRALALYREVALDRAADPEGAAAEEAMAAWRAAGGPVPEPSAADRLELAERFLQLGRPRRVLEVLDALDAGGAAPLPRSALLRSVALLQANRPAEAEAAARPLLQREDAAAERDAAELCLARATARLGRLDEAARLYRRVAVSRPRVPGLSPQQQADLPEDTAYLASWLSYDAGDFRRAADLLGRYARQRPDSKRALDARWFRAWSLHRLGREREARRAFASLATTALASGALYWQARLQPDRSRRAELYRQAFRAGDGDWYALLAAARLAAMGLAAPAPAAPAPPRPLPEAPPDPATARGLSRALALLGAGLRQEAAAELSALAGGSGVRSRAPLLAATAAFAGDYDVPFRMARDYLAPTARAQRWAHPEPFPEALRPAAAGAGVDEWLLLAVMRRESSFRLDARSGAAAEGLLQLIPPTAERLATVLGVPLELADRLGEPAVSIGMGAYYLGLLRSRFPDVPALLAAYNAGPQAAAAWATARAGLPLDEWVEAIPYRETRQYVRGVAADWARYRALYGEGPPLLDPAAPVRAPSPGIAF